jgi:hypothetical protein
MMMHNTQTPVELRDTIKKNRIKSKTRSTPRKKRRKWKTRGIKER